MYSEKLINSNCINIFLMLALCHTAGEVVLVVCYELPLIILGLLGGALMGPYVCTCTLWNSCLS
jgi:hypothetical protein